MVTDGEFLLMFLPFKFPWNGPDDYGINRYVYLIKVVARPSGYEAIDGRALTLVSTTKGPVVDGELCIR